MHIKTTVIIVNPGKGVQARNDIRDSKINAVPKVRIRGCKKHQRSRGNLFARALLDKKRAPKDQVDPICLLS